MPSLRDGNAALAGGVNSDTTANNAAKYTSDPTERLLGRLERVRRCGRGWIARCPAHDDRTASLSITAGDDGRTLLHCFAGCGAADVVAALGLDIGALFPERPNAANLTHGERAQLREFGRQAQWRAALNVLAFESTVVSIASAELCKGKPLSHEDHDRVCIASNRVHDARAVLNAR